MRRLTIAALLAATSACWTASERATRPAATDFYEELAPHGEWVVMMPYGRVWRPSAKVVGEGFYPYLTGGHWVTSDQEGWAWQSDWAWGWLPFHHGRWVDSPEHGWVWVPGDAWAPAWVEWRVGGGLVGWVPLGPQGVSTVIPGYQPRWCFVPLGQFSSPDLARARLPPHREYAAYRGATALPFVRGGSGRGPSVELVRRAGGVIEQREPRPSRALRPGSVAAEHRVGPASVTEMPPPPNVPPPEKRRAGKRPMPLR
ncbi:MAG: hypothetical protein JNK82_20745 [Myxococcaceae bacterium]|nr:hypothetical protein [Myxococcaceae bacterium]